LRIVGLLAREGSIAYGDDRQLSLIIEHFFFYKAESSTIGAWRLRVVQEAWVCYLAPQSCSPAQPGPVRAWNREPSALETNV